MSFLFLSLIFALNDYANMKSHASYCLEPYKFYDLINLVYNKDILKEQYINWGN